MGAVACRHDRAAGPRHRPRHIAILVPGQQNAGLLRGRPAETDYIAGGLTQTLATAPIGAGGTWNSEGTIVFAPTIVGGLLRVSASGGATAPVTKLVPVKQGGHTFPHFLPDGRHFIFHTTGTPEMRDSTSAGSMNPSLGG